MTKKEKMKRKSWGLSIRARDGWKKETAKERQMILMGGRQRRKAEEEVDEEEEDEEEVEKEEDGIIWIVFETRILNGLCSHFEI